MSLKAMTKVFYELTLPPSEKLVMLALADNCNDFGWCWPGIDLVAKKASLSHRQVTRILASLEMDGHLMVEHNQGRKGTNLYGITVVTGGKFNPPTQDILSPRTYCPKDICDPKCPTNRQEPNTPPNTGTPVSEAEQSGAPLAEFPTEEEVLFYAETYKPALGLAIPPGIPIRWAKDYFNWRNNDLGRWPANWQQHMSRKFEADFLGGLSKARPARSPQNSSRRERGEILQELALAKRKGASTIELQQELNDL